MSKFKNKIEPERIGTWAGEDPEYVILLIGPANEEILLGRDASREYAYREALKELKHHVKVIEKRLKAMEQRAYMRPTV